MYESEHFPTILLTSLLLNFRIFCQTKKWETVFCRALICSYFIMNGVYYIFVCLRQIDKSFFMKCPFMRYFYFLFYWVFGGFLSFMLWDWPFIKYLSFPLLSNTIKYQKYYELPNLPRLIHSKLILLILIHCALSLLTHIRGGEYKWTEEITLISVFNCLFETLGDRCFSKFSSFWVSER